MEESDKPPPQQQLQQQEVGGEHQNMAVATADLMANIVAAPQPISTTTSEEATPTSKSPAAAASKPAKSKSTKAYEKKWLENLELLKPCIKADGTIDYASLDEEVQKRMRSFVKDQRKCYRKRENNEATPMTDERYRLLSEAKFNFKPSESNKARSQDKTKKKKSSSPSVLANLGDSSTPAKGKTFDSVEKAEQSSTKKSSSGKKLTPMQTDDLSADSKMPAKKSPKSSSKSLSPPTGRKKSGKPTYLEMTQNAIVALKDRSGSSNIAISKWVLANNEHCKSVPPNMFKSRLNQAIKAGVKEGRFAKVKNSYKISSEWTKKQKAASRAKDVSRKKSEKARTAELEKSKQKKKVQSDEEERKRKEKDMTPEQREAAKKKRQARKKQSEEDKKELEWFRKKRFPMEDLDLHKIEKKHGIKPPKHLTRNPALPHTLTCLVPPHLRKNTPKQYQGAVARASKSGNGELMGGNNDRGLVADAITVFQFFCGDVGLEDADHPVPKFSLKTLFYALDEVQNGNAKAAKSLPPLLTHLFVTALRLVTAPKQTNGDDEDDVDLDPVDLRLEEDLQLLRKGLNPVSWSQICFFYMDLMERYYTSDETLEDGVLPGDDKLDMTYYWNNDKMDIDDVEAKESDVRPLSATYTAYLGNAEGVLYKGYEKLMKQAEPWNLKADELMALLRALTDDVMSKRPDLAEDIAGRAAKLQELTKVKRNALIKYNRVRLQYEGPKKPVRQKKAAGDDDDKDKGDKKKDDEEADADSKEEGKPFVPTATKKQFETAEKAYFRALEALDKGLTKLIARSEPIAFDRNHNAIYFFQHDPTMLHVETLTTRESTIPPEIKALGVEYTPASVWHFIDTKSLFEQYVGSMDRRGTREREALEVCNDLTLLKRKLQDDKESNSRELARKKEKEDLERRLENAKSACDAEDGRRSGRLVGLAQGELKAVEEEIKELAKAHEEEERQEKIGRDNASDYSLLTGLQTLTELYGGQRSTRSNRKSDNIVQTDVELLANAPCHKLWVDERIGGNGTLNILVESLFALEKKCNDLSPWSRQDITREAWRKQLSDASFTWAIDCEMQLGPLADNKKSSSEGSNSTSPSPTKKRKVDPAASKESLNKIITTVKLCLKDLELRVFDMSGKKRLLEEEYKAEEENENLSEEEDNEELIKRRNNWKVKINALKQVPVHRYALIRDVIVAAITVARKSHLNNVAAELKTALQMIRDHSGGEAKYAALKILDKYGGYEGDDDEDEDFDALAVVGGDAPNTNEEEDVVVATMLSDEFNWVSGSIGGEGDVDGSEWSKAIKECKSVSRLAALIQSFLSKADVCLENLKEDNDRLLHVLRSKTALKKHDSADSIWCNVEVTTQLVKAKVTDYPWWPAHRCIPLDSSVKDALEGSGYAIVASVGNENASLFLVSEKDIVDFSSEPEDDLSQYDESIQQGMEEAMGMAKNLWKARNRGAASPWRTKKRPSPRLSEDESAEEKKEE